MSFCVKCGAYIPMDETACAACGYDPEQEKREQEQQEAARREQEQKTSREQYQYAGAQRQEYKYGTGGSAYERAGEKENRTSGHGTSQKRQEWQWNNGQRPLWEDPNAQPKTSYEQYAKKAADWAADSISNRYLSILSYIGPLFLVPLFLRKNDAFARHHANQGLVLFLFSALVSLVEEFAPFGGLISGVGGIFVLVCMIMGISGVVKGRMNKLPLIGDVQLIK